MARLPKILRATGLHRYYFLEHGMALLTEGAEGISEELSPPTPLISEVMPVSCSGQKSVLLP
jgi:hypothetical protein